MPKNPAFDDKLTFLIACSQNIAGDVEKHLDKGICINAPGLHNMTGLHLAALNGHADIVRLLLEHGADPNLQDYQKSTPLHLAISSRSEKIALMLLEKGADPALRDANGDTPAGLALVANNKDLAETILSFHRAINKEKAATAARERLKRQLEMLDRKLHRPSRRNGQPGTK